MSADSGDRNAPRRSARWICWRPRPMAEAGRPWSTSGADVAAALSAVGVVIAVVLTGAVPASGSDAGGDVESGAEIYQTQCAMCHGGDATGMMGMHPALRGARRRLTVEGIEVTVRNGRATQVPMPAFGERLSDQEIADVVAYVAALPDGPRNFGPGEDGGMGSMGRMSGEMMSGGTSTWMWAAIIVLVAAIAAVVGFVVGRRRPAT